MRQIARWSIVAAIACVLPRDAAALPVIYLDDFHQFTAGDDLTTAIYPPAIGAEAEFGLFAGAASVTAVSLGGNIAARWNMPTGAGEDYLGRLGSAFIEEVIDITFRFQAETTNSGFGGFFIRFPTPTLDMQLLTGFMDDGRLAVFTDTPSPLTLEYLPSTYVANHTYDVRLRLDLPSDRYSWFLDGVPVVLNRALPPHINAQLMHQFGFDSNESFGGLGNAFVIDDVQAEIVPEPAVVGLLISGIAALLVKMRAV